MHTPSAPENAAPQRDLPIALHRQISDRMRSRITAGEWPANYRLKPEPELADELGVSRGTLRRALSTLIDEGLLRQVRGRGTFVTAPTIEPAIAQRLSTLSEDLNGLGIATRTSVRECAPTAAPQQVAALLDLPRESLPLRLVRVRSTDAGPVALIVNYVRTDLAPGIETVDFTTQSLFGTLEGRYGLKIGSARRTFSAEAADDTVSAALDIPKDRPVQYLQQVTYLADGRPIEYSDVWVDSNRLRITSLLSRR
ncbi:GntR family transcriptional regulator [Microbacterium resistens]|uniref:GntR family transcriptional regulator n=1 Tax=Microbacterium resistens TaxID=156977 RepID=UPI001E62FAE7|nr:GntR family transcriptional regulator [Microbacterium resistens]